jgi:hypothetical protein
MQALTAARESLYRRRQDEAPETDPPTMEQQQADALALLAESALHHGIEPGAPTERYQVVVHVDAAVLADAEQPGQSLLEDGAKVSAETSQRLACDASRVVMRHDADDRLLEIGARTRTFRRRSAGRSSIETAGAGSRAVTFASVRAITSATGLTAAPRPCPISRCSAVAIIAPFTRRDSRWNVRPMERCAFDVPMGGSCPMYLGRLRCQVRLER